MLVWLPSEGQRSVWVKVDVVDSFTVTLLVQDLLPELQVPQTPRVVIATRERERERESPFWEESLGYGLFVQGFCRLLQVQLKDLFKTTMNAIKTYFTSILDKKSMKDMKENQSHRITCNF